MKINKPMAAITTLAASNGYIIANWYILSISEKAVFPPLNVIFGATAFVALDLAMVAVVFSEPEKDWLGWFLTVATIATTCAFSGGIAWHLFGDLWHTAFAAAQFMIALHVTHDRKLSHRTRVERDGVEQALQVAVTEREEMEQALQQAVTERGEMERSLQLTQAERNAMEQSLQQAVTERDELLRQVEQAVTARHEVVTGRAELTKELYLAETERDEMERALRSTETERDEMERALRSTETERDEISRQMEVAVTERNSLIRERAKLAKELQVAVTARDEISQALHANRATDSRNKMEQPVRNTGKANGEAVTAREEMVEAEGEVTAPRKRGELESLPDNQQQMIKIIAENPEANYQQIADVIGVTKASITRYRQNLEQQGLISRNGTWKVHV